MTPAEISVAKGGDVFVVDYANTDLADTFVFQPGDWGLYTTDGTVIVDDNIRPSLDVDNISVAGFWTGSVSLGHLTTKSSAHIFWTGSGATVSYSLNGGTSWTTITAPTAVPLTGSSDLDIKAEFAGGVEDDPANVENITVYVLKTDTLYSTGLRSMTFSADVIDDGALDIDTAVSVPSGSSVGTIEAWVELDSGTTVFPSLPSATIYVNGVVATPSAGTKIHVVAVLTTIADITLSVGPNLKLSHLAYYPNKLTSGQVTALYAAQDPTPARFNETTLVQVSEPVPAIDIYAYSWSIVSSGS